VNNGGEGRVLEEEEEEAILPYLNNIK